MFPTGAPGFSLFLLRNCIAVELSNCAFRAGWQHTVFLVLLSLLCIGFLTPAVCALAVVGVLFDLIWSREMPTAHAALVVLSTSALSFIGPGAFSVDARLFARRILVSSSPSDDTGGDPGA